MKPVAGLTMITALILSGVASAQPPILENQTLISGYYIPHASDLVVDDAGNVYVLGSAYEDQHQLDVIVNKVGPDGEHLWELYVNGGAHDYAEDLVLDSEGYIWVTGWTDSAGFPVVDAMDDTAHGRDAFLMKVDPADGAILYSTFLGGDYTDRSLDIAIGPDGCIYLAGETGSTDFPTTPDAIQPEPSFPMYFFTDCFVTKLNPAGDQILYSTYFGGTEDDYASGIAVDAAGDILLAGYTTAADFPLVNPFDANPNDIFVAKLSADGSTQLFGSYFGGTDDSILRDMEGDAEGNIYLTGSTQAADFPTTPGTWSPDFIGAVNGCYQYFYGYYNCDDFFVSKISTVGDGLLWGTFLGGTTVDEARNLAVDALGNVYVAGYTTSDDFPGNESDYSAQIVVCKLGDDGADLDLTYFVDSGSANRGNGVAVGPDGGIYFSGTLGVPASIMVCKLAERGAETGIGGVPRGVVLESVYPNPFNPRTTIGFRLSEMARVRLTVHDVAGHLVRTLVDGETLGSGSHVSVWRGRDDRGFEVAAGVYFVRLNADEYIAMRRAVLIK